MVSYRYSPLSRLKPVDQKLTWFTRLHFVCACVCACACVRIRTRDMYIIYIIICLFSPWRIRDDCGGAFAMGCIGGGIFSFWKGYRNSPPVMIYMYIYCNIYILYYT